VPKSKGPRAKTRHLMAKEANLGLSYLLYNYKEGDRVVILCYPKEQKGMPHKRFHGKVGFVKKVMRRALVVEVPMGEKIKQVYTRLEHVKPLRSG